MNRPKTKTYLIALMFFLTPPILLGESVDETLQRLTDKEWTFRLAESPQFAASVGEAELETLTRVSQADQDRRYQFYKQLLADLSELDTQQLTPQRQADYAIFHRQAWRAVSNFETRAYLIPFNSDWGFHIGLARIPQQFTLDSDAEAERYVAVLQDIPVVMDQYIELMREGLKVGMTQPRVVLEGRDKAISIHIVDNVDDSVFFKPFSGSELVFGDDTVAKGKRVVTESVIPAYQRLLDFWHQEYAPAARASLAATDLPGGERYYRDQVRYYSTLDLQPSAIHQIGLEEVARIRAEMMDVMADSEFEGDFDAFLQFLRTDPQFYATTPRELLAAASYYSKRMDGRLPRLFKTLPRQPYGVEPVPEDLAPFFTGGRYSGAPIDSTRAGEYWVNTYNLPSRTLYTLPALTLHEAVPGHHLQNALAAEQGDQPKFRRHEYISAYGEGWALYAEWLGVEVGIYETPYEHFGRLTYEMWRACRLVVDTGLHTMGWKRQQAIDYLKSNTALSIHEITTEIDRYISWPGQALSYKLGELKIKELRQISQQRLGSDFDVRDFHDVVLQQGSVPLPVLERAVNSWLDGLAEE